MANSINRFLDKGGLTRLISWIKGALNSKQDVLTFDSAPTASSTNPVTSGGIATALNNKQNKLTGTSSQFVKGDGSLDSNTYLTSYTETDPTVPSWAKASTKPSYNGSEVTTAVNDPRGNFSSGDSIDEALSGISNDLTAVENAKQDTLTFDTTPTTNSNNPVTSGGVKAAIDALGTPNEIASITTQESSASGGNNVVTITDTDGTVTSFNVKNGKDGQNGADGADGVSLGEIALVQTTGDSEESVMSQKAVTAEVLRAEELEIESSVASVTNNLNAFPEDLYYRLDWISNENGQASIVTDLLLKSNDLRFVGKFAKAQATASATSSSILTNWENNKKNFGVWLSGTDLSAVNVRFAHSNNYTTVALDDDSINIWHTFDLSYGKVIVDGKQTNLQTAISPTVSTVTLTFLSTPTKIRIGEQCIYDGDAVAGRFIPAQRITDNVVGLWDAVSGNFYTSSTSVTLVGSAPISSKIISTDNYTDLLEQETGDAKYKIMSQDAITREVTAAASSWNTFTHVGGCLCYFALDDYPQFDPRECEGISVVFDGDMRGFGGYTNNPYFIITNGNSISTTNPAYAITQGYSNIYGGMVQAANAVNNGCATYAGQSVYAHMAVTLNFKTGEMVLYKNGVLTNSVTPANYDEEYVKSKLASFSYMGMMRPDNGTLNQYTCAGMALFGHILTQSEVTEIYGDGNESTRGDILPQSYYGYQMPPHIVSIYGIYGHNSTTNYSVTKDTETGDFVITMKAGKTYMNFALKIMTDEMFSGRCKREFDFTIVSGTMLYTQTQYNGTNHKVLTITDSTGNDVTTSTLSAGTYHASCIPTELRSPKADEALQVEHKWTVATDTVVRIHSNYKLTDLGAALVCSRNNYRGTYWEQHDGTKLPTSTAAKYSNLSTTPYNDIYKPNTVVYKSNILPQFNGQIAVDPDGGKVYIGYLTSTGGTWKQVSN